MTKNNFHRFCLRFLVAVCLIAGLLVANGSETRADDIDSGRVAALSVPPTVRITKPGNGAAFLVGSTVTLEAAASDSDGQITKVEFFSGTFKLGESSGPLYTFSASTVNVPPGTYPVHAVATDNSGATAASPVISVTLTTNAPPTVSLTRPANNASFTAGSMVTLEATATDADGITKVEFFSGSLKISEASSAPYIFAADTKSVPPGTYLVYAVAIDGRGVKNVSAPISVTLILSANAPSQADTVRFLEQATFGPTPALITRVRNIGFKAFLDEQFAAPASSYPSLPLMPADQNLGCPTNPTICRRDNYSMHPLQMRFFQNAITGEDQLRQRVAFALQQIVVVSGRLITQPSWMAPYLQIIDRNAFGNYRQLLYEITLNPAMGRYLDMVGSTKANPNENYAREILQLFSIGLDQLGRDGTPLLDAQGKRLPTYDQATVDAFARVFTGWNFATQTAPGTPNYRDPMVARETIHDTNAKQLLNGTVLPAGQTAMQDLNAALDNIFNHPSIGPFIAKQLIQHLVTSNPTPAYVDRVATVFGNNRGSAQQLQATIEAILLDPEARGDAKTDARYGHLREPALLITNILRAFNATSDGYVYLQSAALEQDIFRAPTVFNFYQADYQLPGTDLFGPEFTILSTSTALRRANVVNTLVFNGIPPGANAPTGTRLDLSPLQAIASDPEQLVSALDTLMMHNTMSQAMRNSIVQAVSRVPASDTLRRARSAVYLVATSSQYQVQR